MSDEKQTLTSRLRSATIGRFTASTYKPPAAQQVKQAERGEAWFRDFGWEEFQTQYLPGLGQAFQVYPYVAIWEKIWGAIPVEDYVKYKQLYVQEPVIMNTINQHVMNAFSQGYEIDYPVDSVAKDVKEFLNRHDFLNGLKILGKDVLVFGNTYIEVVRLWICPHLGHDLKRLRISYEQVAKDGTGWWWTDRMDVLARHNQLYPSHELENPYGEIVRLKYLDPSYMRVRRDAYGTALGYVQWYMFPLVTLLADEVIHLRYMPSSWTYESVYGVSMIRPILFHQELIKQYEQQMAAIISSYLKPMFVVKAGNPNSPTGEITSAQYQQILQAFARRRPGQDVIVRSAGVLVDVQAIQPPIAAIQSTAFWLTWLHNMRTYALITPKFLTDPHGLNRATAAIVQESYFTFIEALRNMLISQIEKELMPKVLRSLYGTLADTLMHEYGLPKFIFKPIKQESMSEKTPVILDQLGSGVIDINEARTALGYKPLEADELAEREESLANKGMGAPKKPPSMKPVGGAAPALPMQQTAQGAEEATQFQELIEKELSGASSSPDVGLGKSEEAEAQVNVETQLSDLEDWIDEMRDRIARKKGARNTIPTSYEVVDAEVKEVDDDTT